MNSVDAFLSAHSTGGLRLRRAAKGAIIVSLALAPLRFATAEEGLGSTESLLHERAASVAAEFAPTAGTKADFTDGALALAALDRKIADLDAEEHASKKELSELASRFSTQKQRTIAQGRAYYRMTRAGMLPAGGGLDGFLNWATRVERAKKNVRFDLDEERRLAARGAELAKSIERIAKDRSDLANQRSAMDAARFALADESRREAAFSRAFSGATEFLPVNGESASSGFSAARGHLLFPVAQRVSPRLVQREGAGGPGFEIPTAANAPARAVYAGHVAFADRYGSYGRVVIIDHGDHYYTVTGNLATIEVRLGEQITAGQRLGAAGDEGRGTMVYFEVRHRQETLGPGVWLGL